MRPVPELRLLWRIARSALLILLLFTTLSCGALTDSGSATEKAQLAAQLGIDPQTLDRYPYFPLDYFLEVLKPGMSRQEVHQMVRGYKKVFRCGQYAEVYYYYSQDDRRALRMEIIYDEQERYREIRGEDPDSRTISTTGCIPGQF